MGLIIWWLGGLCWWCWGWGCLESCWRIRLKLLLLFQLKLCPRWGCDIRISFSIEACLRNRKSRSFWWYFWIWKQIPFFKQYSKIIEIYFDYALISVGHIKTIFFRQLISKWTDSNSISFQTKWNTSIQSWIDITVNFKLNSI